MTRPITAALVLLLNLGPARAADSRFDIVETKPGAFASETHAELSLNIIDDGVDESKAAPLPARIILTGPDSKHIDGSGRGVYQDGRFFVEGKLTVHIPAGRTKIEIRCGPEYVPVEANVDAKAGERITARARMHRWFNAASRGWHCGDNHVHTQHDATVAIRTDAGYTALQARANGLNFITEADNEFSNDKLKTFDTATFLYRHAPELRPGPFVGHLNSPGVRGPVNRDVYQSIVAAPLPAAALRREVHKLGGALIRTHPLSPPYQLHWMGATEVWSDAVLNDLGDLIDIDSPATELLWFAALNLGNKLGASSYTDCALGRKNTMSPGDRRVYAKADKLDYDAIVASMRSGRTIATNGGPLLTFLTIGDRQVGDSVKARPDETITLRCEVQSLRPVRYVELYHRGGRLHAFKHDRKAGAQVFEHTVKIPAGQRDWFVFRADDEKNAWSITSPIYIDSEVDSPLMKDVSAMLFEISNHTRFIQLRKQFFAHMIATVRPPETITQVRLLRDGKEEKSWKPDAGDQKQDSRAPVTDIRGDYGAGWQWHRIANAAVHFQADWPVSETGWYSLEMETSTQRKLTSHAMHYRADHASSHALSFAHLQGGDTTLTLRGYGEEQALRDIRSPFVGDGWWYPRHTAWEINARLGTWTKSVGGNEKRLDELFRR